MRGFVLAWYDEDGQLRIATPNWNSQKPHETDKQFWERFASKFPKTSVAINSRDIPKDRSQRHLWTIFDDKIVLSTDFEPDPSAQVMTE